MLVGTASAKSCSNIAFIKYWGNRDEALRLPANGSISMNLDGIETLTSVQFDDKLESDEFVLDGIVRDGEQLKRVNDHLNRIRSLAGIGSKARVVSQNSFPSGTGIASSASGFAALTVAACSALGLQLDEKQLSILARLGSGSASRSIPQGIVEWFAGRTSDDSFATSLVGPGHWNLKDLVAITSRDAKVIGSTEGHHAAASSPLQAARVADAGRRLKLCRDAILMRNFDLLTDVIEQDALMMHAVMLTSRPSLVYWHPPTLEVMRAVRNWRLDGRKVAFTVDAGPNVHVITTGEFEKELETDLRKLSGVQDVLVGSCGPGTQVVSPETESIAGGKP